MFGDRRQVVEPRLVGQRNKGLDVHGGDEHAERGAGRKRLGIAHLSWSLLVLERDGGAKEHCVAVELQELGLLRGEPAHVEFSTDLDSHAAQRHPVSDG